MLPRQEHRRNRYSWNKDSSKITFLKEVEQTLNRIQAAIRSHESLLLPVSLMENALNGTKTVGKTWGSSTLSTSCNIPHQLLPSNVFTCTANTENKYTFETYKKIPFAMNPLPQMWTFLRLIRRHCCFNQTTVTCRNLPSTHVTNTMYQRAPWSALIFACIAVGVP